MDDTKQKTLSLILVLAILIVVLSIIVSNSSFLQGINNNKINSVNVVNDTTSSINNTVVESTNTAPVEQKEETVENDDTMPTKFASKDNKYTIELKYNHSGLDIYDHYKLSIDNYLSVENYSSYYTIENDQVIINVDNKCLDKNGDLSCPLPNNLKAILRKNEKKIFLTYNKENKTLLFGDVTLYAK